MLSVPPDWFSVARVFAAAPVLRRAAIVSVPLTMLKMAGTPLITPSRELLLFAMLFRLGRWRPAQS